MVSYILASQSPFTSTSVLSSPRKRTHTMVPSIIPNYFKKSPTANLSRVGRGRQYLSTANPITKADSYTTDSRRGGN